MTAEKTAEKKERMVVSCPPQHPSGQRARAGFVFSKVPQKIDVTAEQKQLIESDPYLTVHKRTSRAWMTAHGLEFTQDNVDKYAKKDPEAKDSKEKGPKDGPGKGEGKGEGKGAKDNGDKGPGSNTEGIDGTGDKTAGESPVFDNFAKKEDVVDALVKFKGQKPGEDFNPEASRDALLAQYRGLPDVELAA